jgi:hypothetical protein
MTNLGWECPRCGKINAPWNPFCDCNKSIDGKEVDTVCNHEWECIGTYLSKNVYGCKKCKSVKTIPHVYRETTTEETHD